MLREGSASQSKKGVVNGAARGQVSLYSSYIKTQSNTFHDITSIIPNLLSYLSEGFQIRHRGFESRYRLFLLIPSFPRQAVFIFYPGGQIVTLVEFSG